MAGDPNSSQQIFAPPVGAKAFHHRIRLEPDQPAIAILISSLEPFESAIFVFQACMNRGYAVRRDISLRGHFAQLIEDCLRLALSSGNGISMPEQSYWQSASSGKCDCFLKLCDRFVIHLLLFQRQG